MLWLHRCARAGTQFRQPRRFLFYLLPQREYKIKPKIKALNEASAAKNGSLGRARNLSEPKSVLKRFRNCRQSGRSRFQITTCPRARSRYGRATIDHELVYQRMRISTDIFVFSKGHRREQPSKWWRRDDKVTRDEPIGVHCLLHGEKIHCTEYFLFLVSSGEFTVSSGV